MCPMCMTTAALIVGSVAATGGFAAIAIKTFGARDIADIHCTASGAKEVPPSPATSSK
jgi:hypothetical protein